MNPPVRVGLWFCPSGALAPGIAARLAAHWLDGDECGTADRFRFERDRRRYVAAHTLVRRVLALECGVPEAAAVIRRGARGRPFLHEPATPGLDFNLAYAHGHSLLGVAHGCRIGVDLGQLAAEGRGSVPYDALAETLAPAERQWAADAGPGAARERRVLRLWTVKKAYVKARGLGLAVPFDSFTVTLDERRGVRAFAPPPRTAPERWRFVELEPVPGVLAAVALTGAAAVEAVQVRHGFPWAPGVPETVELPPAVG
ncbi:4'-phosphopantetheinyl transferase family protein [Streptomyces sp. BYX5S]